MSTRHYSRTPAHLAAAALLLAASVSTAHAQWTFTNLHPTNANESIASGAGPTGLQGGYAFISGTGRASLWSGTAASRTDLHPVGTFSSEIRALSANQQVGITRNSPGAPTHAALWSGSAGSWTDLHPSVASNSDARAVSNNQQVGFATIAGQPNASLWTGSAASWTNLNPTGATSSIAHATSGSMQGGYAVFNSQTRAGTWTGSANSWTSLHPAAADSSVVFAMSNTTQGGLALVNGTYSASLWTGSASSWTNLHPAVAGYSIITGVSGSYQAGWINVGSFFGPQHAGVWQGSAGSFFDLHSVLPDIYSESEARSISSDGSFIFITGYAYNTSTNRVEALLWSLPVPSPGAGITLALGTLVATRRRREQR